MRRESLGKKLLISQASENILFTTYIDLHETKDSIIVNTQPEMKSLCRNLLFHTLLKALELSRNITLMMKLSLRVSLIPCVTTVNA